MGPRRGRPCGYPRAGVAAAPKRGAGRPWPLAGTTATAPTLTSLSSRTPIATSIGTRAAGSSLISPPPLGSTASSSTTAVHGEPDIADIAPESGQMPLQPVSDRCPQTLPPSLSAAYHRHGRTQLAAAVLLDYTGGNRAIVGGTLLGEVRRDLLGLPSRAAPGPSPSPPSTASSPPPNAPSPGPRSTPPPTAGPTCWRPPRGDTAPIPKTWSPPGFAAPSPSSARPGSTADFPPGLYPSGGREIVAPGRSCEP